MLHNIIPIPSITNIPSTNINNTQYIYQGTSPGVFAFGEPGMGTYLLLYNYTIATILYSSLALLPHTLKAITKRPKRYTNPTIRGP